MNLLKSLLAFLCIAITSNAYGQTVNFNQSTLDLNGQSVSQGTSLQFGPDGRLYVLELKGDIKVFDVQKNGTDDYDVSNAETLSFVKDIPNHNDDGTAAGNNDREATGITVAGTATNPIIYATSSDPRVGGPGGDTNLDTNSGVITRITWNGNAWKAVDIVRGLPRSEENHATNGLEYVTINSTNYLIISQGGHTNAGGPCDNFAWTTEYALSAAVLSVNLDLIDAMPIINGTNGHNDYIYDLPTVDDPTIANSNGINDPDNISYDGIDINDPWGGNDGLNQAMIVIGGPVQIFSPGYRNTYDLVVTESGAVYITDNGANNNWGGFPTNEGGPSNGVSNVTNDYYLLNGNEPGSNTDDTDGEKVNNKDHLSVATLDIQNYTFGSFYGGHPTPIRANPAGAGLFTNPTVDGVSNTVFRTMTYDPDESTPGSTNNAAIALPANWPPVPVSMANPVEGDWRAPGGTNPDGPVDEIVTTWNNNANGIDEYTFDHPDDSTLKGSLIAGKGGSLFRVQVDANGQLVDLNQTWATGLGGNALGITCNGSNDPFPGTIWVANFHGNAIKVLDPGVIICVDETDPAYVATDDYDNDGYQNDDEILNSTDYCAGSQQPDDHDKDAGAPLQSNLIDTDDDNDGILDQNDVLQIGDPLSGGSDAFDIPAILELEFTQSIALGGFLGLGFTGLMNNGDANPNWLNWLNELDPNGADLNGTPDLYGGAVGLVTMYMNDGTADGITNNQEKGFQFGIDVEASDDPFTVECLLKGFNGNLQLYDSNLNVPNAELGIQLGDGSQSNFVKFIISLTGFELVEEDSDVITESHSMTIPIGDRPQGSSGYIIMYLDVVPSSGLITARYSIDGDQPQTLGSITAQGSTLQSLQTSQILAIGAYGSSHAANEEVEGSWDYFYVQFDEPSNQLEFEDITRSLTDPNDLYDLDDYFQDNSGDNNLNYTIQSNTNNSVVNTTISNDQLALSYLSTGTASITIRATDQGGLFVDQSFNVLVSDSEVLFRINAGGPQLAAIPTTTNNSTLPWLANTATGADSGTQSGLNYSVNTGSVFTTTTCSTTPCLDSSVPDYAPVAMYLKERWDPAGAAEMMWEFETGNGTYTVNLFMANGFNGTSAPGQRVFDIEIEGAVAFNDVDLSDDYGHQTGGMASYVATVNDGILNIDFIHGVENPLVNGIEIIGSAQAAPITITTIPVQENQAGDNVSLQVNAAGGDPSESFTYSANNLPTGLNINTSTGVISGTIDPTGVQYSPWSVVVTVNKPSSAPVDETFTWILGTTSTAVIQILPGNTNINASTYSGGSFQIINNSPAADITSVSFDLSTSFIPNVVFDPNGTAGDATSKDFTINQNVGGTSTGTFNLPVGNGGFQGLDITFTDFGPGETFTFSADQDPSSIEGLSAPGPNESGSISGLEQAGTTVVVSFSDGSIYTTRLYSDNSNAGAIATAKSNVISAPTLSVIGHNSPAIVNSANQSLNISGGPANGTASLLHVEAGFFEAGGNLNQELYEVNSVISVNRITAIPLDGNGSATIPSTLLDTDPEAGYNYFLAAIEDGTDFGLTSNTVILEYDASYNPPGNSVLYRVNAGGAETATNDSNPVNWSEDQATSMANGSANTGTPSIYYNTTAPASDLSFGAAFNGTNATGYPDALFSTERYSSVANPDNIQWNFPVTNGDYLVNLIFAETWTGAMSAGVRVFDVMIEGTMVLDDFDATAAYGWNTAGVESFPVTITDGNIDIDFIKGLQNPNIKAIEIVSQTTTANNPPVVNNPGIQSGVEGDQPSLQIVASDVDACTGLTYSATGLPPTLSIDPNTGLITGSLDEGMGNGTPGAFLENNGLLIIEAESDFVDAPGGWEPVTETGDDFLKANTNSFGNATNGQVLSYDFEISTAGVYRFQMKSAITGSNATEENDSWFKVDNSSDVHFFSVDGGALTGTQQFLDILNGSNTSKTLYYPKGNAEGRTDHGNENPGNQGFFKVFRGGNQPNKWQASTIDNNGFPIYAYFPNPGSFSIQMSERSAGHKVDRFALYHIDDISTGLPTATLDGPESQRNTQSIAGASANSPYSVIVEVSDGCTPSASSTVNFTWIVTEDPIIGNPEAFLQVTPGSGLTSSTFTNGSFILTNTGTIDITSISIDMSTAIINDIVYDPTGTAGDAAAKCLEINSGGTATGYISNGNACADPFSQPHNGIDGKDGYDNMTLSFSDFNPGESITFSVDIDPTSIQEDVTAGDAGSVSGFEMIGSTVTVDFLDATSLCTSLFDEGSLGGSDAELNASIPQTAPSIIATGVISPAVVSSLSQTIDVTGDPDAVITLLQVDGRLYIDAGGGGYDIDPFEVNTAMAKNLYTVTLDASGNASIPVTLLVTTSTDAGPDGGINTFIAAQQGSTATEYGKTSNTVVLEYDPTPMNATLTVIAELQTRFDHSGEFTVTICDPSSMTPIYTGTSIADASGSFSVAGIVAGTYDVLISYDGFLSRAEYGITLVNGSNSMTMLIADGEELLAGDANNDEVIDALDPPIINVAYGLTDADVGYDPSTDFDGNGVTDLFDYTIMSSNYTEVGDVICQGVPLQASPKNSKPKSK